MKKEETKGNKISEDELVHLEPAPIILHHAPAQPEGYVGDDDMEEDEEEDPDEDPDEELNALYLRCAIKSRLRTRVPSRPRLGKKMGVDDDYDEEMEMDEDDEDNGRNDNEDDAEVINAYEEVNPLNRPPPTSDKETEFAPPMVPIVDVNNEPIPPVIQLGGNYHVGESSSTGTLLAGVTRLDRQMFDRYKTKKRMAKKFKEDEFCMNRHEYDITALDKALVTDKVAEALAADRATRNNPNVAGGSGGNGGQVATLGLDVANCVIMGDMRKLMMGDLSSKRIQGGKWSYELKFERIPISLLTLNGSMSWHYYVSKQHVVLNDAVCMAHTLTEQKIQDKAERVAENNKRKWESNNNQSGNNNRNNYRDNTRHHQHNNKRQRNAMAITTTLAEQGRPYARDCKSKAVAMGANVQPILTCYECEEKGQTRNCCPKRNNPQGGNATGKRVKDRMLLR
ncbi:hypothetical protein Tco_1279588, partial [Tanacetum coccineum]